MILFSTLHNCPASPAQWNWEFLNVFFWKKQSVLIALKRGKNIYKVSYLNVFKQANDQVTQLENTNKSQLYQLKKAYN